MIVKKMRQGLHLFFYGISNNYFPGQSQYFHRETKIMYAFGMFMFFQSRKKNIAGRFIVTKHNLLQSLFIAFLFCTVNIILAIFLV